MKHGFIKVASANCVSVVADCLKNADNIISLYKKASDKGVKVVVFPELCVTASTCGDLFFSTALLRSAENAVCRIADATKKSDTIIIVGFPLIVNDKLFNCAAFCQRGQILGIIPKKILTFAEKRYFSSYNGVAKDVRIGDRSALFGYDILFECIENSSLKIGIEIGAEAFAPISPSCVLCARELL